MTIQMVEQGMATLVEVMVDFNPPWPSTTANHCSLFFDKLSYIVAFSSDRRDLLSTAGTLDLGL